MHARLAQLKALCYEQRAPGVAIDLHRLVPGRSWVLVGRSGQRLWLKFVAHRDCTSIKAIEKGENVIVLGRVHVLGVWTLDQDAVRMKMLCGAHASCHKLSLQRN